MTDKVFTKRLRDLTDEAIRESLAEISVEFQRRFSSPPVVEEGQREAAIGAAYLAIYGDGMDPLEHPEGWEYATTIADAILALTPVEGGERRMLLDLLATIHRDGGQYVDSVGIEQATADAVRLSAERIVQSESASAYRNCATINRQMAGTIGAQPGSSIFAALEACAERMDEIALSTPVAAQGDEVREALEPFATFYPTFANEDGWTSPMTKERIVDWFGPTDFRRAAKVFATFKDSSHEA